ncbi:DNA-methyltransferase [Rosistilla oblonga]|uniref:DNA-methyltransferase n=1 Tax=Rosistilla oblonga TaxID=2527990 RepID=UPI003A978FA3
MICKRCRAIQSQNTKRGTHWTCYHGDTITVLSGLPDNSFDAIVTDPPYGSGANTAAGRTSKSSEKYRNTGAKALPEILGDSMLPEAWRAMMQAAIAETYRVARPGADVVLFCDWRSYSEFIKILGAARFQIRGVAIWDKRNSRPTKNGFRAQTEWIISAKKTGTLKRDSDVYLPGVFSCQTLSTTKRHLTQKPLELMRDLIRLVPDGGHVLDMFQGSGTTGVASIECERGLRYTGIEGVKAYHELATERLTDASKRSQEI